MGLGLSLLLRVMFYRQAIGFFSRIGLSAPTTVARACRRTTCTRSLSSQCGSEFSTWNIKPKDIALWILLYGQAAIFAGVSGNVAFAEDVPIESNSKNDTEDAGLRRIEDGSVISNIHTINWRVFTDNGRNLSRQGKLGEAEKYFLLALEEAKEGKENDSETLIRNSIGILEEGGQVESFTCLRRLRYLSRILLKSNRLTEAENVQRRILHIMELSKGRKSLETVIAAEHLALTLQSNGNLKEAKEFLQHCLDVRKSLLPENHIQIGANMLHMARLAMLHSNQLMKADVSEASSQLDKAKDLLDNSIRIAQRFLDGPTKKGGDLKEERASLIILLQSYITLGILEESRQILQEPSEERPSTAKAEQAFHQCITAFKEVAQSGSSRSICHAHDVKSEYLSCLKHLTTLISESKDDQKGKSRGDTLKELKDEIKCVEAEVYGNKKH
ncbi:hypothetical protein IFM89_001749 [Coptis chinensis]|uniref:Kinesin light chain n=1 Tax=Coptis chinensis TaxID=261450 RepID=A0A835HMV4_9MAGN|nr:hypothetical protein IFM89_001749 [Coptis chinensis]